MLGASFPRAAPDGVTPMPKTKHLMEDGGAMALNFHIHTPICNPSRSELLSGRYFHNIKTVGGPLWSMHVNEDRVNAATFARNLKQTGYTVGMFGKYMNTMPSVVPFGFGATVCLRLSLAHSLLDPPLVQMCVGLHSVPAHTPGLCPIDAWLGNPGGDYIAPSFQISGLTGLVAGIVPNPDPEVRCPGGPPSGTYCVYATARAAACFGSSGLHLRAEIGVF